MIAALIVALFVMGEFAMLGGMFSGLTSRDPRMPDDAASSLTFAFLIA